MMQELNYILCGDYYIPDIRLPEESRPIGRWGRMHRDYIKEHMIELVENDKVGVIIAKDYCAIIGLNQKDLENQGILA